MNAPQPRVIRIGGLLLVVAWLAFGCSKPAEPTIPDAAPDAVQAVMEGLTDNQPQVLWEALPPSYQADIRDLIASFCDQVDSEVYDRAFRILDKGVNVLESKKEFIFNSPMTLDNPIIDSGIGLNWKQAVGVLDTLVNSELSSIESLRRMDPGEFLSTTGCRVMEDLEDLAKRAQRSPGRNPWVRMREAVAQAQIQFVPGQGNQGYLTFSTNNAAGGREIEMTKVEGRWVPAEMAANWETRMADARARLERFNSPEVQEARPMVMMILGTLDQTMDSLLAAQSQKEFDAILNNWKSIGAMAAALRPKPNPAEKKPDSPQEQP